jgi:hypothetical protein
MKIFGIAEIGGSFQNLIERGERGSRKMHLVHGTCPAAPGCCDMLDFPIDPELRIRATPERVLRRTDEALKFVRRMTLTCTGRLWQDVLRDFETIRDEWSAIEAVVHLEFLLEAEGLLIEENQPQPSPRPGKIDPLPARLMFASA